MPPERYTMSQTTIEHKVAELQAEGEAQGKTVCEYDGWTLLITPEGTYIRVHFTDGSVLEC